MQNGRIKPHQLSASSSWDKNHGPSNGRLNFRRKGSLAGAWCARHNTRYQWLQVYFGRAMRVVKIATQGRQDYRQWVTQYYLSYSQEGAHFAEFKINSNRKVSDLVLLGIQNLSFRQALVLRLGSAGKKGLRSHKEKGKNRSGPVWGSNSRPSDFYYTDYETDALTTALTRQTLVYPKFWVWRCVSDITLNFDLNIHTHFAWGHWVCHNRRTKKWTC